MYLDAVEARTQGWLYELKSPRGTPLGEVFQEELGMDAQEQARFLLYREMIRASGPAVPAPSLTGQYAGLRGLSAFGGRLTQDPTTGLGSWLTNLLTWRGAARGAGGALRAVGAEGLKSLEWLTWFVGVAVFLTWWGPYIVGLINLVLVGLFPLVMLWALIPGTQFQPLAHFFVALLLTSSMPLWWALVDVAARFAATDVNVLVGWSWSTMITTLGILLIPVVTGILMFAVFRAVGGLWRAGL
jgi:hypothetical protein